MSFSDEVSETRVYFAVSNRTVFVKIGTHDIIAIFLRDTKKTAGWNPAAQETFYHFFVFSEHKFGPQTVTVQFPESRGD